MQTLLEKRHEGSKMTWEQAPFPVLSDAQFFLWQALLEERTGMYVPVERKSLLQTNLSIRMRELEISDYDAYYAKVIEKPAGIVEWSTLVDRFMVKETRFYRNPESLSVFLKFLERRLTQSDTIKPLNIWSVGCCTGEEPYTLAIMANELLSIHSDNPLFGVTATDISLPSLQTARKGIYQARKLLDMQHDLVIRYFSQVDQDHFQVNEDIKRRVCFSMANIMDIEKSPVRNMDVIYCQNVLIYFRKERKQQILDSLVQRLAPGGMLVIGQGEVADWRHPLLTRISDNQTLAYIRQENS